MRKFCCCDAMRAMRERRKAELSSLPSSPAQASPTTRLDSTHLGFQIPMNIPQLVQLVDSGKHFGQVEPRVLLLEYAGIVEEGAEIATGDEVLFFSAVESWGEGGGREKEEEEEEGSQRCAEMRMEEKGEREREKDRTGQDRTNHGEVDVSRILESVEEAYEPRRVGRSEDIAFGEDVTDLRLQRRVQGQLELGWSKDGRRRRREENEKTTAPHPSSTRSSSSSSSTPRPASSPYASPNTPLHNRLVPPE